MSAELPLRPSIPPLAWFALGQWLGVALSESAAWAQRPLAPAVIGSAAVIAVSVVAFAALRSRALMVLVLCGVVVGVACGGLYWQALHEDTRSLQQIGGRSCGEAITDAMPGEFGSRSSVRLGNGALVTVAWPKDGPIPSPGETVSFFGVVRPWKDAEGARRDHRNGVAARMSARVVRLHGSARSIRGLVRGWRTGALNRIERLPPTTAALVSGVVLGDRTGLAGTAADEDFRTTGLSHLVAVSGGHLVVVAMLCVWLLRAARFRPLSTSVALAVVLGLYVVATGAQSSAVRSWLMAVVASAALVSGRRTDTAASLAAAVSLSLAVSPPSAFDIGFRLSVAAVAGLIAFARLAESWTSAVLPRRLGFIAGPISLTLVAQAVTAPVAVPVFGSLSLVAPAANLLAGPLVSIVLVAGLGGVVIAPLLPWLAALAISIAGTAAGACIEVAGRLADVPLAAIPLGWTAGVALPVGALLFACLWALWPPPSRTAGRAAAGVCIAAAAVWLLGPSPQTGRSITMLDVGQGDAILLRDQAVVLVDAGPGSQELQTALMRNRVRHIDALLLTHLHEDHIGGIDALTGLVSVDRIYVASGALSSDATVSRRLRRISREVRELEAGRVLRFGSTRLHVLAPDGSVTDGSENESSLVVDVECGDFSAVLTGDAECDVLGPLADGIGDIDVLKVGHHGSAKSLDRQLLDVLRPELALVSVGEGNRYGHPAPMAIDLLTSGGSRVERTDRSGDVCVRYDERGWKLAR